MEGIVTWAANRARMTFVFILISIVFGALSYISLPKEGEPDIEIPALFISIPAPGISAQDAERLIVKPLETRLVSIEGLNDISSIAQENYGGIALEFDFGWDRDAVIAEVREEMAQAENIMPDIVDSYSINEINFSEFPIVTVAISGELSERELTKAAEDIQDELLGISGVLSADIAGIREQVVNVIIDIEALENYDITANELVNVVQSNNQLVPAGALDIGTGNYAIKIPSSFKTPQDVMDLPVKVSGNSVITLGDVADIRLTFANETGYSRYNGEKNVAIQVVKRKGVNIINLANLIRTKVENTRQSWPEELQKAITTEITNDQSNDVKGMVSQLEGSVLTAILLVMIAVLGALGMRSSLLIGFSIPTSFLLTFALMATLEISISNIVMFGLILAVGMLVDSSIVIVEYADQESKRGAGPMQAFVASAQRMFWPIISSTATTLCAFLPLLLWPGVAGQFMGNLPKTIIFVLGASLIVALVFLPVVGGVLGRISRKFEDWTDQLREKISHDNLSLLMFGTIVLAFLSLQIWFRFSAPLLGFLFLISALCLLSIFSAARKPKKEEINNATEYKRSKFGAFIYWIISAPKNTLKSLLGLFIAIIVTLFIFIKFNNGVEFFAPTEPEQVNIYVQARGNLSLEEKDRLVRLAEERISNIEGIKSIFAFSGSGGLNQNTGGGEAPKDTIGTISIELDDWQKRYAVLDGSQRGDNILATIDEVLNDLPGMKASSLSLSRGPASAKPINLRFLSESFDDLETTIEIMRTKMKEMGGFTSIEDTRPLPAIDMEIAIDVTEAGKYGANVMSVGSLIQLVTRGNTLGQMRIDGSEEEVDIVVRFPEKDRKISTIESLRVRTPLGLVPVANFISQKPVPAVSEINRIDQKRYYALSANLEDGFNATVVNRKLEEWFATEPFPPGVTYEYAGDFADQSESTAFLGKAFLGSLGLMLVILLAQFNSFYRSVLVLSAVVLSVFGVLLGHAIMGMPFSVIMSGTGVLALAGIIVNNNIILIDSLFEHEEEFGFFEAVTRSAESRIRPILLTAGTTILGVTPMMLGLSIDFANGGYTVDAPTSLWWKPLATSIVFGLGVGTLLTLIVTPTLLASWYWVCHFFGVPHWASKSKMD